MNQQNAFSKKNLQTINIEKRDWMEELNLPPELIKFLRGKAKVLQIGGAVALLCFLGYYATHFHLNKQREQSTALLAKAVEVQSPQERKAKLQEVVDKFGGSDAGLWARIDLAHQAFDEGHSAEAITFFEQALEKVGSGNSIIPLIEYGLANAYEQKKELGNAMTHFLALAGYKGFERQGELGVARIQEKKGELAAALKTYEKVAALNEKEKVSGNEWLDEKIRSLKLSQSASKKTAAGGGE